MSTVNCEPNQCQSDQLVDDSGGQIFSYCPEDMMYTGVTWPCAGNQFLHSKFDKLLLTRWNNALKKGYFWYTLDEMKKKKIPGKIGFIAQLNTKRFNQRRKPTEMQCMKQPFQNNTFNFTKVKKEEILFVLEPSYEEKEMVGNHENQMIINVSPIEFGHALLVPRVTACNPQVLTADAMRISLETCLLSLHRGFRIGFNSLCACASVNHLHLHVMYIDQELAIDRVRVSSLGNGLFEIVDYVVRGFALQLQHRDIIQFAKKVESITNILSDQQIAHNMLISRTEVFNVRNSAENESSGTCIGVFLFPKHPAPGIKDTRALNSSCYDIAGYLLLKDTEQFGKLDEIEAVKCLNKYTFSEDEFATLKDQLDLLSSNHFLE